MKISSKFPLEYRFGPHKLQGAALMEVFVSQMIGNLFLFLHHANIQSQLSTTLLVSYEAMQIEIGSRFQFFQLYYNDFGILTPHSRLRQMWKAISKYGITLRKHNSTLPLPRHDDFALMDRLLASQIFNRPEVESINRCRLYLNVFFRTILPEVMEGKLISTRKSVWKWSRQPRPPASDWKLWVLAIHEAWILSETTTLRYPLGNWINKSHQLHKFVYDGRDKTVYETSTNGTIRKYQKKESTTRHSQIYSYYSNDCSIPDEFILISIVKRTDDVTIGEIGINDVITEYDNEKRDWDSFTSKLHPDVQYLSRYASIPNQGRDIATAIRNRTVVAVTDASVEQRTGRAAISWVITDKQESFKATGDSGCPKFHSALDS